MIISNYRTTVGLRAQHAIIRDENVPNKASKNVDVALKLNPDDASKDDDIDIVRGNFSGESRYPEGCRHRDSP